MPLYEYNCPEHGKFEVLELCQSCVNSKCPECGKLSTKIPSMFMFRSAEPFRVIAHDGTILQDEQTTEKMPPPGYRHSNTNLVCV